MVIADRILSHAQNRGGALAIEDNDSSVTWRTVGAFCEALGALLERMGVAKSAPIGLVSHNRSRQAVALMALLVLGRPAVMISSAQSSTRMAEDLRRLRVAVLLGEEGDFTPEIMGALHDTDASCIVLQQDSGAAPTQGAAYQPNERSWRPIGEDAAVEVPTSGTTGTPKRVAYTRRTVDLMTADLADAVAAALGASGADQAIGPIVDYLPFGNVAGVFYSGLSAWTAEPLVLLEKFSVDGFTDAARRHRPAIAWLLPTPVRMLLDAKVDPRDLASIKAIRTGSGPIEQDAVHRFKEICAAPILRQYGATEFCGVVADWSLADSLRYPDRAATSVGRARPHVKFRTVDPDSGASLPPGRVGLLEVLASYVSDQWMRTNDLATVDEDGFLVLEGRVDDAINRGGFKVVPEMVANVLRRHPSIRDAIVVPMDDARLGQVPVACVERVPNQKLSIDEIESFARRELLAYQVPHRFLIVDALPRTANLKPHRPAIQAMIEAALHDR